MPALIEGPPGPLDRHLTILMLGHLAPPSKLRSPGRRGSKGRDGAAFHSSGCDDRRGGGCRRRVSSQVRAAGGIDNTHHSRLAMPPFGAVEEDRVRVVDGRYECNVLLRSVSTVYWTGKGVSKGESDVKGEHSAWGMEVQVYAFSLQRQRSLG